MPNPWNIQILYACWNPNLTLQRPFLDLSGPQGGQSNLQAKFHHIYRAGQDVPALLTGLRASAAPWTHADPLTTLSVTFGFPDVPRHPLPLVCPLFNIYEARFYMCHGSPGPEDVSEATKAVILCPHTVHPGSAACLALDLQQSRMAHQRFLGGF